MSAATLTAQLPLTTTFGAHKLADQVALRAHRSGLSVEHHHDNGRLTRDHLITVTGGRDQVQTFLTDVAQAINDFNT